MSGRNDFITPLVKEKKERKDTFRSFTKSRLFSHNNFHQKNEAQLDKRTLTDISQTVVKESYQKILLA